MTRRTRRISCSGWKCNGQSLSSTIVRDGALTTCLGFASFVEQFARFDPWFKEFESQLTLVDLPRQRLTELFNLLLTLGHALDPDGVRYEWHSWQERDANGRVIGKLR